MTDAAANNSTFQWAVDADGRIVVPADEVARHGLTPGEKFTIVEGEVSKSTQRTFREIFDLIAEDQRQAGTPKISDEEAAELAQDVVNQVRQERKSQTFNR